MRKDFRNSFAARETPFWIGFSNTAFNSPTFSTVNFLRCGMPSVPTDSEVFLVTLGPSIVSNESIYTRDTTFFPSPRLGTTV